MATKEIEKFFFMAKGDKLYYKALRFSEVSEEWAQLHEMLMEAYIKGSAKAAYALGTWYLFGRYVKKNYKRAVDLLEYAANEDVPLACYDLGVCYETGKGVAKDTQTAFKLYLKAALLGDKKSYQSVGRCYYYGIGIEKNREVASIWLELSPQG